MTCKCSDVWCNGDHRTEKEQAVIDAARAWSTHVVHFRDTSTGYTNVVDAAQALIDAVRALDGEAN